MTPHHLLALTLIYAPLVVFFFWAWVYAKRPWKAALCVISSYLLLVALIITGISLL